MFGNWTYARTLQYGERALQLAHTAKFTADHVHENLLARIYDVARKGESGLAGELAKNWRKTRQGHNL